MQHTNTPASASLQLVPIIPRASSSIINLQYSIIPQKNNLPSSAMQKKQNLIGRDARASEGVDIKPNNMQRGYIYTY